MHSVLFDSLIFIHENNAFDSGSSSSNDDVDYDDEGNGNISTNPLAPMKENAGCIVV